MYLIIIENTQQLVERAYELLSKKAIAWYDSLIVSLPNLILAGVILLIFYKVARLLRKYAERLLMRLTENLTLRKAASSLIFYLVVLTGIFAALNILDLEKTVTSLLAGAGVIGLALSFAFQDLATNFVSGLFIALQKPFTIGDYVETNGFGGFIENISIRSVTLRTLDEQHVIIPSKAIFQSPLTNYSTDQLRRISIEVGVSYAENLDRVQQVAQEAIRSIAEVLEHKPVLVHFFEFGESSVNCRIMFWIGSSSPSVFSAVRSHAIVAIHQAFIRHGITIPFPIRTLDFGIKGGSNLKDMLNADRGLG